MLAGGNQQLLADEPGVSASSSEVVDVLEGVLNRPGCPQQCRDFALTALMKLSVRFSDQAERIKVGPWCTDSRTTCQALHPGTRPCAQAMADAHHALRIPVS